MSIWHLLILFFIILLVFGPQRLEGIGVSLGRAVRGFKEGLEGKDSVAKSLETPARQPVNEPEVVTAKN